jgi:hypothetical protein
LAFCTGYFACGPTPYPDCGGKVVIIALIFQPSRQQTDTNCDPQEVRRWSMLTT